MIHIAFRVQHTTRWTPNSTGRNLIFFIKMASLGCTPMSDKANSVKSLICPFSANLFSYYFLIFHDILYICYSLYIYILPEQFPVYSLYISHTFPTYSPIHSLYIYVCISIYIYMLICIYKPRIYIYICIYTHSLYIFTLYIPSIHILYIFPI